MQNTEFHNWISFLIYANFMLVIVICFTLYSFFSFQMLIMMFHKHRLAFKTHAPR